MSSTPRRGRPPVIDQNAVIEAALALIGRVGVEGLTMKSLANELGVTPMAAYRYVENKSALLTLVVEEVLSREAPPTDGPWQERLWVLFWSNFQQVSRYPGLADFLYRGAVSEQGRVVLERGVTVLKESGLSDEEARRGFSDIYAYILGRLVLRARAMERERTKGPRGAGHGAVPGLTELSSDEHIRHGFDAMLAGLTRSCSD